MKQSGRMISMGQFYGEIRTLPCGCTVKIIREFTEIEGIKKKRDEFGFEHFDFKSVKKCANFGKDGKCNF